MNGRAFCTIGEEMGGKDGNVMKKKAGIIWLLCLAIVLVIALFSACEIGGGQDVTAASTDISSNAPTGEANEHDPTDDSEYVEEPTQQSSEEETTVEEITTEEATTAADTKTPEGGDGHGIVRDGTPKKYFTIRFDDGITQDKRIIEILKKYDAYCCTFYINTGLYGVNWPQVGQQLGRPDITHLRYTKQQLRSGIYDGFDVECHSLTHKSLKTLTESEITNEIVGDMENVEELFGYKPVGLAWPGGDKSINEQVIETVVANTDIRYGSCTARNENKGLTPYSLPKYWMTWYPTCSVNDSDAMYLLRKFIAKDCKEDMLFFMWGHGYELDQADSWDQFEQYIKMITEAAAEDDSIVLVTNAEFYQLFKDEIPVWKE